MSEDDTIELDGSRGEANFVMKWPGSSQQAYIKIIKLKACKEAFTSDDTGFVRMVALECRGLDIDAWTVTTDFKAKGTENTVFYDVDLSDEDGWCDFDEKTQEPVSVSGVETRITKG